MVIKMAKDAAVDLEKAIGAMDAAAQGDDQEMAGGEKEVLLPSDLPMQVQGDDASKVNQHARKEWLCWFLIVVWVMILTDHFFVDEGGRNDHAESGSPYSMLAKFIGLLSAICLMFGALIK